MSNGRVATTDDRSRRADYLEEVTTLLYPPGSSGVVTEANEAAEYIVVPNLRRPRVLVPATSRRLAVGSLRRYTRPASATARLKRDAAVASVLAGVDRLTLPHRLSLPRSADDITAHLGRVLDAEVHFGIHIGPARANRKPVLQILDAEARTLGFAKLGTTRLTRKLVTAETDALRTLAGVGLRNLRIPRVLHAGTWGEHNVLVQEALPGWKRPARVDWDRLTDAMTELACCMGVEDGRLGRSDYAVTLEKRLLVVAERSGSDAVTLVDAARQLLERNADQTLRFGSWHGDWSPWNMSMLADDILLWDFERFTTGVPMGFDALHYVLQRDIVSRAADPTTAVLALLARGEKLLRPFGVEPRAARITVLLYLVDLAARYLTDRQAEAGAPLGALGRWLLPTLLRHVAAEGGIVL